MKYYIDEKIKKILNVHYSNRHEEIRRLYPDQKDEYEDAIIYSIDKNLKILEKRISEKVKNKDKREKIFKLAKIINNFYNYNNGDNRINYDINIKSKNINQLVGNFNSKDFYDNLQDSEKKLFDRRFNNVFKYNDGKFIINFFLNKNKKIIIKEAFYIIDKNKILDLRKDFNGMTLEQTIKLLHDYGFKEAEKYVNNKKIEFEYKTEVIDDIYKYIIYLIMSSSKSVKGAKRAMLFAQDYRTDISIPMRYALSSKDKNYNDIMNYYYSLGGKDTVIFADYYENQNNLIKLKHKFKLSEIEPLFKEELPSNTRKRNK